MYRVRTLFLGDGTGVFFEYHVHVRGGPVFEGPDLTTAHELQIRGEIRFLIPPLPEDKTKMRLDGGQMASRVGSRGPPEALVTTTKVTLRARHSPQMLPRPLPHICAPSSTFPSLHLVPILHKLSFFH